jgi:hypothetical protein
MVDDGSGTHGHSSMVILLTEFESAYVLQAVRMFESGGYNCGRRNRQGGRFRKQKTQGEVLNSKLE